MIRMKNFQLYIVLAALFAGLFSCGDNEDFSALHVLTDAEIAEMHRQDSIAEAERNRINADLLLEYTVEATTSDVSWEAGMVTVEMDKIAELFGLTEAEVLAGIAGESGAPEIKCFAIDWTTRADYANASTTNAPWGHWWGPEGDVTSWGDEINVPTVFCEFDYEAGEFFVGQLPGNLEPGTIKVIEALKYNELRVAVVITINASAPGQLVADVVSTLDLSIDVTALSSYDGGEIQFDLDQALTDLGVSSIDEVKFIGVNEDGSYNQEPVTNNGFWYDMNGYVGSYGDDASVFTEYYIDNPGVIVIGQFPDHLAGDEVYNIKYGLFANDKIVMFNIAVNILGYQDPETAPAGDPADATLDVALTQAYNNTYARTTLDVKETLRNAFKMTTYQIHKAIGSGELKLYQGATSDTDPAYTSDVPGYWLKADGTVGEWSEGVVYCCLGHSETELYIYAGNHPDNAASGNTVTTTYIATLNGAAVTFNITYTIE